MELVDGFNENNEPTGDVVERYEAFDKGLWRRSVSSWIINEKGEILLQKRAANKRRNPNRWAKTGGQVDHGETPDQAIKREVKEELGIDINDSQIKSVSIYKNPETKSFGYNYIFKVNYKIEDYKLQKEEVSDVMYYPIPELEKQIKNHNPNFSFSSWADGDFEKEMKLIRRWKN